MKTERLKRRRGFTLVELVVVLAIMALLATAAIPLFSGYTQQAKDTVAINEASAVVRAAQIKAVELTAQDKLSSFTASYEQIMASVGLPGSIVSAKVNDFGTVTNLEYTAANGLLVRYDAAGEPRLTIVKASNGENGGPPDPSSAFSQWTSNVLEWTEAYLKDHSSTGRDNIIADIVNNHGGLLAVDPVYKQNSAFSTQDLYWRPYYLKDAETGKIFVFSYANSGTSGHAYWKAKIIYFNGVLYQSNSTGGTVISGVYNCKSAQDLTKYLLEEKGFTVFSQA